MILFSLLDRYFYLFDYLILLRVYFYVLRDQFFHIYSQQERAHYFLLLVPCVYLLIHSNKNALMAPENCIG